METANLSELVPLLRSLSDEKFRDFNSSLLLTVAKERMLGVRTPQIGELAQAIERSGLANDFMATLPHALFEEDQLHAKLISRMRSYDECIERLDAFLPHIDNWATCDSLSPKALARGRVDGRLLCDISRWLASEHTYTVRFGLLTLMRHYLDEGFDEQYLSLAASVSSKEYYIKMMQAWFFATALAKQYTATLPYLEGERLDEWVRAKTITKACESYRIPNEHKAYLKILRRERKCLRSSI